MNLRKIFPFAAFALVAAGFALFARAPAERPASQPEKPELIAATFNSAWCSSCKILKPKLTKIMPHFAGQAVAFVELDFTFGARDEVRAEAERFGLGDIYERNKDATGFTLLVDADTGEIVDTITMNFSESAMKAALAQAIAIASHTDEKAVADAAAM